MEFIKNRFKSPLFVIFFTLFIDLLGFGILIPVIPQLLANPASPYFLLPNGWKIDDGYILLGFLTAIYPLMQFIATPILGQFSDKFGRKKILTISIAGTCLSYILFAIGIITRNIPLLFISRGFDGITGGNISVAQAAIADVTTPENRTKTFGLMGAIFGLGFIIGPYIGGKLSDPSILPWFDATTPFWFAALLSLVNTILIFTLYHETNLHMEATKIINWTKSIADIAKAFTMKKLRPLFITGFLFNAGFTFFTTFASVFFISKLGWNQGNIGDYFSYVGLWIAFSQAVVTRKVTSLLKEHQIMKFSLIGTGLGLLLMFLSNQWWQILLVTPFFAIFNGLSMASLMGLVSKSVGPKIQGEVLGINASVSALAQAIPPMLSGYIAAGLSAESPLLVAALTIVFTGVLFIFIYKYHPIPGEEAPFKPAPMYEQN